MTFWQSLDRKTLLEKTKQVEKIIDLGNILIEKRKVSFGEFGLFVTGVDQILGAKIVQQLAEICKSENALFIQIESLHYDGTSEQGGGKSLGKFVRSYYKKFIPPYTALIDLKKSEEEILGQMKPKGRYNIGLAGKKGVTCAIVEKNQENISVFYKLFQETIQRDIFAGNTQTYYEVFLQDISNSELIFASFEGKIIAAGIFVFQSDIALYYYGASSSENRNVMAPYLLQWTAILEAKKRNCILYDFLGVAGPFEKNSPLEGVTDFKLKFTSDVRLISESFLFVHKKKKYFFIKMFKKFLKLVKK